MATIKVIRSSKADVELAQQLDLCRFPRAQQLVIPPKKSLSRKLRPYAMVLIVIAAVLPHVFAGVFNYYYNFEEIIDNLRDSRDSFERIQMVINAVAYPLALVIALWLTLPILRLGKSLPGQEIDLATMQKARHRCLNLGHYAGLIGVAEWSLAGIAYPVSIHFAAGSMPGGEYAHFFGSLVLCGLIAAAYPFFAVTYISLRVIYPSLLQNGSPYKTDIPLLQRMVRRSGIYLASAGMAPFLGVLATLFMTKNTAIQLFALKVFATVGFFGLAAVYTIYRRLQSDVEALVETVGGER